MICDHCAVHIRDFPTWRDFGQTREQLLEKREPEVFVLFVFHENTNMKHTKKNRGCKRCFFFTDLDMEIDIDKNCCRQEKAFAILAIN